MVVRNRPFFLVGAGGFLGVPERYCVQPAPASVEVGLTSEAAIISLRLDRWLLSQPFAFKYVGHGSNSVLHGSGSPTVFSRTCLPGIEVREKNCSSTLLLTIPHGNEGDSKALQ